MRSSCIVAAAVCLHAQVVVTQPGGEFHSIAVNSAKRVFVSSSQAAYEIRDGTAAEWFHAPDGVTITTAAFGENAAVFAGFVQASVGDRDIWVGRVLYEDVQSLKAITLGGHGTDVAVRVAVDATGAAYLLGNTDSPDFPVTQGRWKGDQDGVLIKLNSELATVYATYLGGASRDVFEGLAVDASGSAFVAAASSSAELALGAQGAPAYVATDGLTFASTGGGAFRATVQAWHTPNENIVFAGTAGQGLFRSADQGQTWEPLNQGLNDLNITSLAGDTQTLYAGTPRALFRSTNGGTSWSEVTTGAGGSGISALAVSARDRNIVYAGSRQGCGLFRSADGGRTWQTQRASVDLCVTALFATQDSAYAYTPQGVFQLAEPLWRQISDLGGVTSVIGNAESWYAVVPEKAVMKSGDAGATWEAIYTGRPLSIALANDGKLLVGTADQGVISGPEATFSQPVRSLAASGATIFAGTTYLPDIYVAKISPRGDQIVYSTFIGGSGSETSPRLAVDGGNNVLIAATTTSTDITATLDAVQRRNAGGSDILLAKLSPAFDTTAISYFGGAGDDTAAGIAIDARGFAYLAGTTTSQDLRTSPNAPRRTNDGTDAFLAAFSQGFNSSTYATYAGSNEIAEKAQAIAMDGPAAWVAGSAGEGVGFATKFTDLVSYSPIQSVRNAASLAAGPVAPFSTAVIDGGGFGDTISGLSVRIGESEASVLRSSDTRIEVAVPGDLEPGSTAQVAVTSRTGLFQGTVAVDRVAPGIFSANRDGQGVALASVLRIDSEDITTITPVYECVDGPGTCTASPVEVGDETDQLFLLLRATGLRNRRSLDDVQVTIGGKPAEVVSAGAVDSFTGADQIVVKIPAGLAEAGRIVDLPIVVTVEGKTANTVTMSLIG